MSTLTCLISGVSYQVKSGDNYGNLNAYDALEVRGSLDITIEDYNGTYSFVYGQPVVLSDSVLGTIFEGFVGTDKPTKLGPASPTIEHALTCFDKQYLVDKRTNYSNYLNWYAGDIIVDFVQNVLSAEGVTVAAALRHETTIADFSAGTLSGTAANLNDGVDGCLELARSGSDISFSETTTTDFSAGTLTNVTASNNLLTPTTSSAISLNAVLSLVVNSNYIYMNVWSGSMTVGTNDTLHYEMWIKSDNPELCAGIDLTFNDGSHMYDKTLTDTKGLGSSPDNSIGPASNAWYSRDIKLVGLNGKTITNVTVAIDGVSSPGTYQVYFRNVYLASQSGSPFFSTTATATQLNPATVAQASGFSSVGAGVTVSVVQAWVAGSCSRVSTLHSISAVSLLASSLISYIGTDLVQVYASYDGGSSYQLCINDAPLPALPPGTNLSGLSLQLKEVFALTEGNPTVSASLADVNVTLKSAPPYTKTDLLKTYFTQSDWTTGATLSHTTANSDGTLTLTAITRDWNDNAITSQTSFFDAGTTQSAASGAYFMTVPASGESKSRLDLAGSLKNFTLDVDITTDGNSQTGIVYRTTFWGTTHNSFGWLVAIENGLIQIGYGANSNSNSYTQIDSVTKSLLANVTYHLTIIVQDTTHLVYFDNAKTPTLNITDSTYNATGNIGLRLFTGVGGTSSWDNLAIVQNFVGTWTSASISLASVGTYGTSVVSWLESNTDISVGAAIIVQASVDGGTTYNLCTNGSEIPGLTNGQNVSATSIKFKITIGTTLGYQIPSISDFVIRVIGNYGTVTGTRTTAPIGIDYIDRANQANWGTASDGQTWAKTGTGTAAVAANTLTLANTTGDVYERLGSRTGADMDETVPFKLSASGDIAGMTLRYVDANNHYKIAVSTTNITISKKISGVSTTLAIGSLSLSTNTWYYLRFRVVGMSPVLLYGNVWLQGTLEPTIDSTTYQWNDNNWTLTASD